MSSLYPWEWPQYFPWTSGSAIISSILAFILLLLGVVTALSTAWIVGVCVIVTFMCEGLRPINKDERMARYLVNKRGMLLRKRVITIVPDGAYVKVTVRVRVNDEGGRWIKSDTRRFHAVEDAEEAHEYVDKMRSPKTHDPHTSEARGLAKVLSGS